MSDLGFRRSEETIRALRTSCELLSGLLVKLQQERSGLSSTLETRDVQLSQLQEELRRVKRERSHLLNDLAGTIGDRQRVHIHSSETCTGYEYTPQSGVMIPHSDARNRTDVQTTNLLPEVLACKDSLLSVLSKLVRAQNLLLSLSRENDTSHFHEYSSLVA
ncbi:hypothetical protein NDN08_002450 [Rhodosorus marinus]|uniref:Uncharacterized protein n=1 Tax=Rhodosorus marinus TaxID=101924 RepID=A0AAV8UV73_9RHOD|nr:hypothetical protein NDN08_002450 [Rhodosorus marinus]